MNPRFSSAVLASAVVVLAVVIGGCRLLPAPSATGPGAHPLALSGDEVVLDAARGEVASWITARRQLRLRCDAGAELPLMVATYVRPLGERRWTAGPRWTPGLPAPTWQVPGEGAWELLALEMRNLDRPPSPAGRPAQAIVHVDWTPPVVEFESALPDEPMPGGAEFTVDWRVRDAHPASVKTELQLAVGLDDTWQKVADLPARGPSDWRLPNRSFAGARLRLLVTDAAGNQAAAPIPGTLTVVAETPRAQSEAQWRTAERDVRLPYELAPGADVERVELWVTPDEGAHWQLAGYDADITSPFVTELEDGRWGYAIVVVDRAGNRSPQPAPGDRPEHILLVDRSAPNLVWGAPRARQVGVAERGTERVEITVPFTVEDLSLVPSSLEASVRGPGGHWLPLGDGELGRDRVRLFWRRGMPEPLALRVEGVDEVGNGFSAPLDVWPSDLLDPPELRFTDAPRGWHRPGDRVLIGYALHWPGAPGALAELSFSSDGVRWQPLVEALSGAGSVPWVVPAAVERVAFRLVARGSGGRTLSTISGEPVRVDGAPPVARIIGPRSGAGDPVHVLVWGEDPDSGGVVAVELHARREGTATWSLCGRVESEQGTIAFHPVAGGHYELWAVAIDRAGNRSREPEQAGVDEVFAFVAEEEGAGVRLLSFQGGGVYAGGTRHKVFVDWSGRRPVAGRLDLELSVDDGGSWRALASLPVRGEPLTYSWLLPEENIDRCRLRAVAVDYAGERTLDQSRTAFTIDSSPPRARITSVRAADGGRTRVEYEASDAGGAGLSQVWLYTTRDDGNTWQRWREPFADTGSILVDLPAGLYGFALQAVDRAHNTSPAPTPGQGGDLVAEAGATVSAHVSLISPRGGRYPGGSRHYVFWKLTRLGIPFPDGPVSLQYRAEEDEKWTTIADGLPAEGRFPWYVPERESGRIWLRVVAVDENGEHYVDDAGAPLEVDSSVPVVVYAGDGAVNTRPAEIEVRVDGDAEQVDRIELWARPISTPYWQRVATASRGERLLASLADGEYELWPVGVDAAGNRGRPPSTGERGGASLLVDTVPPALTVEGVGERDRLFHGGDLIVIRPTVIDHHAGEFPVRIALRDPGADERRVLAAYHPSGNEFPFEAPAVPGVYTVEVTATDLAGNYDRRMLPIQVIPTPPEIRILRDPASSVLAAGAELDIEWESRHVHPLHRGTMLEYTVDGERWQVIARDLPADGEFTWKLPAVDSNRVRLRVTVRRDDGLEGRAWSGHFTVSRTVPEVDVDPVRPGRPSAGG